MHTERNSSLTFKLMKIKRFASAATQSKSQSEAPKKTALAKESVKVTKLNSGVVVTSLENHSPVTRIAAVINAGARDEKVSERGASHALRVYSGLVKLKSRTKQINSRFLIKIIHSFKATKNYSKFGLSRTLDQIGAELT